MSISYQHVYAQKRVAVSYMKTSLSEKTTQTPWKIRLQGIIPAEIASMMHAAIVELRERISNWKVELVVGKNHTAYCTYRLNPILL